METKSLQLLNVVVQGNIAPSNCEAIKFADTFELLTLKIQIEMELEDRRKKDGPLKVILLNDEVVCGK